MRDRVQRLVLFALIAAGVAAGAGGLYIFGRTKQTDTEAERFLRDQLRAGIQFRGQSIRPGELIGSILIPRLNTQAPVVEGTGKRELKLAPGHLSGTALPGRKGNSVIAGHRDSHFRSLRHLREGDVIFVETGGEVHTYRIVNQTIVSPTATHVIDPTPQPTLTLITCYPFYFAGHAPKRYILQAELVS